MLQLISLSLILQHHPGPLSPSVPIWRLHPPGHPDPGPGLLALGTSIWKQLGQGEGHWSLEAKLCKKNPGWETNAK